MSYSFETAQTKIQNVVIVIEIYLKEPFNCVVEALKVIALNLSTFVMVQADFVRVYLRKT